jgi:hypothetical protein
MEVIVVFFVRVAGSAYLFSFQKLPSENHADSTLAAAQYVFD